MTWHNTLSHAIHYEFDLTLLSGRMWIYSLFTWADRVISVHIRTLDVLVDFSLWAQDQHCLQASQTILDSEDRTQ